MKIIIYIIIQTWIQVYFKLDLGKYSISKVIVLKVFKFQFLYYFNYGYFLNYNYVDKIVKFYRNFEFKIFLRK